MSPTNLVRFLVFASFSCFSTFGYSEQQDSGSSSAKIITLERLKKEYTILFQTKPENQSRNTLKLREKQIRDLSDKIIELEKDVEKDEFEEKAEKDIRARKKMDELIKEAVLKGDDVYFGIPFGAKAELIPGAKLVNFDEVTDTKACRVDEKLCKLPSTLKWFSIEIVANKDGDIFELSCFEFAQDDGDHDSDTRLRLLYATICEQLASKYDGFVKKGTANNQTFTGRILRDRAKLKHGLSIEVSYERKYE